MFLTGKRDLFEKLQSGNAEKRYRNTFLEHYNSIPKVSNNVCENCRRLLQLEGEEKKGRKTPSKKEQKIPLPCRLVQVNADGTINVETRQDCTCTPEVLFLLQDMQAIFAQSISANVVPLDAIRPIYEAITHDMAIEFGELWIYYEHMDKPTFNGLRTKPDAQKNETAATNANAETVAKQEQEDKDDESEDETEIDQANEENEEPEQSDGEDGDTTKTDRTTRQAFFETLLWNILKQKLSESQFLEMEVGYEKPMNTHAGGSWGAPQTEKARSLRLRFIKFTIIDTRVPKFSRILVVRGQRHSDLTARVQTEATAENPLKSNPNYNAAITIAKNERDALMQWRKEIQGIKNTAKPTVVSADRVEGADTVKKAAAADLDDLGWNGTFAVTSLDNGNDRERRQKIIKYIDSLCNEQENPANGTTPVLMEAKELTHSLIKKLATLPEKTDTFARVICVEPPPTKLTVYRQVEAATKSDAPQKKKYEKTTIEAENELDTKAWLLETYRDALRLINVTCGLVVQVGYCLSPEAIRRINQDPSLTIKSTDDGGQQELPSIRNYMHVYIEPEHRIGKTPAMLIHFTPVVPSAVADRVHNTIRYSELSFDEGTAAHYDERKQDEKITTRLMPAPNHVRIKGQSIGTIQRKPPAAQLPAPLLLPLLPPLSPLIPGIVLPDLSPPSSPSALPPTTSLCSALFRSAQHTQQLAQLFASRT